MEKSPGPSTVTATLTIPECSHVTITPYPHVTKHPSKSGKTTYNLTLTEKYGRKAVIGKVEYHPVRRKYFLHLEPDYLVFEHHLVQELATILQFMGDNLRQGFMKQTIWHPGSNNGTLIREARRG